MHLEFQITLIPKIINVMVEIDHTFETRHCRILTDIVRI
jgi:hypothetical protein